MDDPGFSVVIPLFNKQSFIERTLASVSAQTLPPREVLVIDNGSSDGGDRLVKAFALPGLRLLHEGQRGPGPARNCGISAACSAWIAFLDADDLWAPDHLERLAEAIAQCPQAALVSTGFRPITDPLPPPPAGPASARELDYFAGREADLIWTSAIAVRHDALLESGGFPPFEVGEDTDLWIRLAMSHRFAISPARTVHYLRDNGGIMDLEQAALTRRAPDPSPVFATIAALLADPRHRARHAALRQYGDGLRRRFAGQLVYNGHPAEARNLLRGASRRGPQGWLWFAASLIPPMLLRPLTRLWRSRKG